MEASRCVMNSNDRTALSRTLSKILRHKAHDEGLTIRKDGYISLSALLSRPKLVNLKATLEKVQEVVAKDEKSRFTLMQEHDDVGEWFIRANQGHSLAVEDLALTEITDASQYPIVLHGTSLAAWKSIETEGLRTMKRNHIHCATGVFGTVRSGVRKNCQVFIHINLPAAMRDGIRFYESSNGVILTFGIDGTLAPQYFSHVLTTDGTILLDHRPQDPSPTPPALSKLNLESPTTTSPVCTTEEVSRRTIMRPRPLFGGALETVVPESWLDASNIRQIPDTQEVFLDPDDAERSFIVELVERLEISSSSADECQAGTEHFAALCEDNDATECRVLQTELVTCGTPENVCILVSGIQTVAKFNNASTENTVSVVMGIVRLVRASTDVLIMHNAPYSAGQSLNDEEEIVRAALVSFQVKDWSLFPECHS